MFQLHYVKKTQQQQQQPTTIMRKQLLAQAHATLSPNVAGYIDAVQPTKLSDWTTESTSILWQIFVAGWAFPLNSSVRRPIRFRDAFSKSVPAASAVVLLEPVRRDDVAAYHHHDANITWCGWHQNVQCYRAMDGSEDKKPWGMLEMQEEVDGPWVPFTEIHRAPSVRDNGPDAECCLKRTSLMCDTTAAAAAAAAATLWDKMPLLCINLDRRSDRLVAVSSELARLGRTFGSSDVPTMRVQAVNNPTNAALGCYMSHLRCVELAIANGWPAVAILEDDFECTDPVTFSSDTDEFMRAATSSTFPPWDVFMLGTNPHEYVPAPEYGARMHRVLNSWGAEGYIVNGAYLPVLRDNMRAGIELLAAHSTPTYAPYEFRFDNYWRPLQARDAWLIYYPFTVKQSAGFSDIEKITMDPMTHRACNRHEYAGLTPKVDTSA